MYSHLSKYAIPLYLLVILLLLVLFFTPSVYADGGAPQLAYVAGGGPGISVIDIAQRRVTNTIAITTPQIVLLSLDGSTLYVAQPLTGKVTVMAAKTGKPLCSVSLPGQPSLLALSLDGSVLFAAGQGDTSVRALDPLTCKIQRTFETQEPIYGIAVAASTATNATPLTPNQLWITGQTKVTVFEADGHLLGSVSIPEGPQYISIPAGFTAYVTTRQGSVVAIDLDTRQVIRTLLSGGQFGPMDYDATTGEIYVPDREHNLIDALDPITINSTVVPHEPAWTLNISSAPQSIAITSDGQLGFVALANGKVMMVDIPGRAIITSITVGGTPHFIITGLYPPVTTPSTQTPQSTIPSASTGLANPLLIALSVFIGILLLGSGWFLWRISRKRTTE